MGLAELLVTLEKLAKLPLTSVRVSPEQIKTDSRLQDHLSLYFVFIF